MKIGEAEIWLRKELLMIYDDGEAGNIAALVLEHITGLPGQDRLLKKEVVLLVQQLHRLTQVHHRLMHHEPVQYALGEAWFYNLKLYVDKHVLIPRPETEELVDWIVKDIKASGKIATELKILDVGTGSGCIALALKNTIPTAEVWGCDVSDEALTVARRNGSEGDIRVDFVAGDFLDAKLHQLPTVDIIVSNPPYIPLVEKNLMQANVVGHEPHRALFVPDEDPLIFYKALIQFAREHLYDEGSIYVEIHEEHGNKVQLLFQKAGYVVELKKDMQGKDRMVKARM